MPEGEPDLRKELQEALERNRRLEAQLEEGKVRIRYLEEQVQALLKRIYGSSSEPSGARWTGAKRRAP